MKPSSDRDPQSQPSEESLAAIRRSKAVAAVAETQRLSVQRQADAMTQAEIEAEISAVRRSRRRQGP
jgi:hypothetical protein